MQNIDFNKIWQEGDLFPKRITFREQRSYGLRFAID